MDGDWRWTDVSFFSSLAFSLVTLKGWFPNVSHLPLKEESNWKKASRDFPHKHIPNKETTFPVTQIASWSWTNKSMNSHSFLICGLESIFFYNVKKWFCFYLNFSFYLSASQPGRQGATSKGGLNIQVCTCSLKGHEVCNVKIKQRLCLKKNLCRSGWSVVVLLLFSFLCVCFCLWCWLP